MHVECSAYAPAQAVNPEGTQLVTGGKRGAMHLWQVPDTDGPTAADSSHSEVSVRVCCDRCKS